MLKELIQEYKQLNYVPKKGEVERFDQLLNKIDTLNTSTPLYKKS